MAERTVIAGGSGFLGVSLARWLTERGHEVLVLSRSEPVSGPWTHHRWDGRQLGPWMEALDGASGLVNLAGRTVDCVKNALHKDQILRSRIESTRVLGEAVRQVASPPRVWVQMSTAHIYGDSELPCRETSETGYGLAPDVGRAWESAFDQACPGGIRRVVLRTSFVLGRGGGALSRLAGLARVGLGGTVGSGRQGMSWIHESDMNRMFYRGLSDDSCEGVYIASGPNPVTNREFMRTLRRAIGMPIGLPAFEWQIRLAAPLILRTDPELAIYGRYVYPERMLAEGFEFEHADLRAAFNDLLSKKSNNFNTL